MPPAPKGAARQAKRFVKRRAIIEQGLERAKQSGACDKFTFGAGRGASCTLVGMHHLGKRTRRAKAITSIPKAGTTDTFHFEIKRPYVKALDAGKLDSLVLIPDFKAPDSSSKYRLAQNVPIVLLPLEKLMNKKRGDKGIKRKSLLVNHKTKQISLMRAGSKGWVIRIPQEPRGSGRTYALRLSADGLLGWIDAGSIKRSKTSKMRRS